ncbi:aminotransferase class III-fold pyridoxal phosphate-dependent enzyme [Lentisalinibacter sediminis]|uniref:aminotransferase class III-fold pyridoxal phosphate-dependent enzyme n=1 Tax=Lentisalinibacter sediminis TaxID=2992237 RepID=UPI00386EF685
MTTDPVTTDPLRLMTTPAPDLTPEQAADLVRERYALPGSAAPLDSERDRNFRYTAEDGREFVLKISNAAESPAVLDFQARALDHISRTAPELPVPRIEPGPDGELLQAVELPGGRSLVRLVSYLPGVPVGDVSSTPALRRHLGATLAALGRALQGFFHPAARHPLLWDVSQTQAVRELAVHIGERRGRELAERVFARHAARGEETLAALRAQVIHNDFNPDNVLVSVEDPERVSGIIDFGDMVHAPLVNDLAVLAAYQVIGHEDELAVLAEIAAAFHAVRPLEPPEVDILFHLVQLRLAASVAICAWRAGEHPDNVDYILGGHEASLRTMERLEAIDEREAMRVLRHELGLAAAGELRGVSNGGNNNGNDAGSHDGSDGSDAALRERRRALLGPGLSLTYDEPLHIVRGEGVWLYDASGRAHLDAYNNVACVGHCHPVVTEAIARQSRTLNTNTRYLHEHILDYAERLAARLPGQLSVCFFVCTGSEANDLAWQMARAVTGGDGAIVSRNAYHGNTTAVAAFSPEELPDRRTPDWVVTVPAPDVYNGPFRGEAASARYAATLDEAIASLADRGHRPAAFFVDTIWSSDGIYAAPAGYLADAWQRVRAAGGICVADEVQAGFARTGDHFWGFELQGVVPDIVTLGKPMGNGHPLAAVITTPEIAGRFARDSEYFNTFGGNPVSCAAGLAVLHVIEHEALQENARVTGDYLREALRGLQSRHEAIGDVRGAGLFAGVELVRDRETREPAPAVARAVMNGMRREGVLVGRTGIADNVLKIRPPLVFSRQHADRLVEVMDRVLVGIRVETAAG